MSNISLGTLGFKKSWKVFRWSFKEFFDRKTLKLSSLMMSIFLVTAVLDTLYAVQIARTIDSVSGVSSTDPVFELKLLVVLMLFQAFVFTLGQLNQEKLLGHTYIEVNVKLSSIMFGLSPKMHASFRDSLSIGRLQSGKEQLNTLYSQLIQTSSSEIVKLLVRFFAIVIIFSSVSEVIAVAFFVYLVWSLITNMIQINKGRKLDADFAVCEDFLKQRWEMPSLMFYLGMRNIDLARLRQLKRSVIKKDYQLYRFLILNSMFRSMLVILFVGYGMHIGMEMIISGRLEISNFYLLAIWLVDLKNVFWRVSEFLRFLGRSLPKIERLYKVAHLPTDSIESPISSVVSLENASICIRNLTYFYPGDDRPSLREISHTFQPGSKVALVGHSGSGKSTLATLLWRATGIFEGEINLVFPDGKEIPLRDVAYESWGQQVAVVLQDHGLYGGTVREILTYGLSRSVSDEELWEIIKEMELRDLFIDRQGLDTVVSERGIKLSGGQRQRMAIANALLRKPKMVMLDEATSALDAHTQDIVMRAIDKLLCECGGICVIIAHRLSTIKNSDEILVLKNGELVGIVDSLEKAGELCPVFSKSYRLEMLGTVN